jgi:hypothetical protein
MRIGSFWIACHWSRFKTPWPEPFKDWAYSYMRCSNFARLRLWRLIIEWSMPKLYTKKEPKT